MRSWIRLTMVFPLCLAPAWLSGCGDGGASGPRGSVSGKVTYDGQPVPIGYVNLFPADGNGAPQAGELVDGEYQMSGVAVGKKRIVVQTGSENKVYDNPGAIKGDASRKLIPANAIGNNQEVEIKEGSQTIDLSLRKPTGP